MGQVIDFWSAQEVRPPLAPAMKCRCQNCGADLWHISCNGEVCCADCDEICPLWRDGRRVTRTDSELQDSRM